VPTSVLGHQGQIHQRPDRAVQAQQSVGQLEQLIRPSSQAPVELVTEPGQPVTTPPGIRLAATLIAVDA
jgi:hypothetical protein